MTPSRETRSQRYAREYLTGIGYIQPSVVPDLCPTCGASWKCDCPPPPKPLKRREGDTPTRKSRARFRQGEGFASLTELVEWIAAGNWTYWNARAKRPLHSSWMAGQSLQTLRGLVKHALHALPPEQPAEGGD